MAGVGVFLVYKINCFYHLSSGEIFSQISSLAAEVGAEEKARKLIQLMTEQEDDASDIWQVKG